MDNRRDQAAGNNIFQSVFGLSMIAKDLRLGSGLEDDDTSVGSCVAQSRINKLFRYVVEILSGLTPSPALETDVAHVVEIDTCCSLQCEDFLLLAAVDELAKGIASVPFQGIHVLIELRSAIKSYAAHQPGQSWSTHVQYATAFFALRHALVCHLCPRCTEEPVRSATCDTCQNRRHFQCKKCLGKGCYIVKCRSCDGTGQRFTGQLCLSCHGSGKKNVGACNACRGVGFRPCRHCEGKPQQGRPRTYCWYCTKSIQKQTLSDGAQQLRRLRNKREEVVKAGITGRGRKDGERQPYSSAVCEREFVCQPCEVSGAACDWCWGSGHMKKSRRCWVCNGMGCTETGTGEECFLCDGFGKDILTMGTSRPKNCWQCAGSGKDSETCKVCSGYGRADECRKCRGRGKPFCKQCHALFRQSTKPAGPVRLGREPAPGVSIKQCDDADLEALKKLWVERHGYGSLSAAWSIDNPLLSWRLRKRQQEFRVDYLEEADEIQGFHGTAAQNIISIVSNGFDADRRCGQVFGAGEYFAKCPEVSRGYCNGDSYMLVCRLLLGKQASSQALGDGDHIWVPSCQYYVISYPSQVVPLYILKFAQKPGPSALEKILRKPAWTTIEQMGSQAIPANRPCNMTAELTDALWIGYLHPEHSDEILEKNVTSFLEENLPEELGNRWKLQIVRGKYTQAKVRLQSPVEKALVHDLNNRDFVEAGSKRLISVDDAHGSPGSKCFRTIAQYCRGRNSRFVDPCWCDHGSLPTALATYSLTPIDLGSARGDEIVSKFMSSAPFHNGMPQIVEVNAINNTTLSNLFDRYRAYLADKNKEEPKLMELYHGTNNNILDAVYADGLHPPSDMAPAEDCPVSGGKGLCTSICDNRCNKCTTKHDWNKCHMYGLGIYLADIAQKSHRYVSQAVPTMKGKRQHRMILCSVLVGRALMIEGHLKKGEAMHDVTGLRRLWNGELEEMCVPCECNTTLLPKSGPPVEEHDLMFVKGLGGNCHPGFSVHNSEYIAFHPYQCLPRYEIVYEL